MRTSFNLIIAFSVSLVASPAFAWNADGHRTVCAIAWNEMQDSTRERVEDLLGIERREQFADSCTWADEYRTSHPETASWHFIEVPVGATLVDPNRDCKEPKSCVVVQIERELSTLRGTASKADKAQALKLLANLIGEVHQPLQVSYARDARGYSIEGNFLDRPTNMHEIWDTDLIRSYGAVWYGLAVQLQTGVSDYQRRTWAESKPQDWANESLAIALKPTTQYVGQKSGFVLGQDYADSNMPVILERLSRAGVRLGYVLNKLYGSTQ